MIGLSQGAFHAGLCALIFGLQFLWMIIPHRDASAEECLNSAQERRNSFAASGAVAVLLAAVAASLLHHGFWPVGDAAVFAYIGERMGEGLAPYRDLFDHKGPFLYLIEAAGCVLTPGSYKGLWILEYLNMLLTLGLMLAACTCMSRRKSSAVLAVMLSFLVCGRRLYEGGNLTEEYAMPWIALGMLVYLRFFQSGNLRYREIALLGSAFGAVAMLRINMAALWLAWTPITIVLLVKRGQARAIPRCIGSFLLGLCAFVIPFLLWMYAGGFLKEFWECYVLFNLRYAEEIGGGLQHTLHLTGWVLRITLPALPLLLLGLVREYRNPHYLACLLLITVSIAAAELSGRDYPHYLMILLPPLAAGFAPVFDLTGDWFGREKKEPSRTKILITCAILCAGSVVYHQFSKDEPVAVAASAVLQSRTKPDDDVLVLGNNAWLYLDAGRSTKNRYFYQTPPIEISDELRGDFLQELCEYPSDVVVSYDGDFSEADEGWRSEVYETLTESGYTYLYTDPFGFFVRDTSLWNAN